MEIVDGVEGSDEGKLEENGAEKSASALSSPKQIANPIVYKLVRVEGDGRLVPATDDEVMEVEDFLECEKGEMCVIAETGQSMECMSIKRSSSGNLRLQCSEDNIGADTGKLNSRLEEIIPSLAPALNDNHINHSGIGEWSRPPEGQVESELLASAVRDTSKPDFSLLKRDICLDKLSIRELHELFQVTFGRETTVKDKQWLKRRISMGLTNSCDVSATNFVYKDNRLVKKVDVEIHKNVTALPIIERSTVAPVNINSEDSLTALGSLMHNQVVSVNGLRNQSIEHHCTSEDFQTKQRAAKRIRKPTKRYIEELSEVESRDSNQRMLNSVKSIGLENISPRSYLKPNRNGSSERIFLTRLDSLGGSGVQIPCVSRIRRSRPRKNIISLMEFHPSGMGTAAKVVDEAIVVNGSQANSESGDEVMKSRSAPTAQQACIAEPMIDGNCPVMGTLEQQQDLRPKAADSPSHATDGNSATVPTAKGGMRRKHHRAWTLVEVMKLVEGVSKCGAGRWSEIKRLAFASYSYRTSVDLKDKWRNLLKASFAQTPVDEGINSRKHGSTPIPEPILLRVRELAEINAQGPLSHSSSKVNMGDRTMHEASPGYL